MSTMNSKYCFKTVTRKLNITALQIWKKRLLAGIGGELWIFDIQCSTREEIINIFDNSTIYGMSINSDKSNFCIYGGKEIAVLSTDCYPNVQHRLRYIHKWRVSDWVLCCHFVKSSTQIAVLSAHNVLSLWDTKTGDCLFQAACTEKCLLYSGAIVTKDWLNTVVISGTVFQQVIVWAVTDDSSEERPVLHKLCGHKGVIFSVLFDERTRQIASTSDDRSVRVWSVVPSTSGLLTSEDWRLASLTLVYTIFGHTARVWKSYILADRKVVSVGEDSLLSVWQDGGECVLQREIHQGSGVFCFDVDESKGLVVTGGRDGGISLWPLEPTCVTSQSLSPPTDTPRRLALLSGNFVKVLDEETTKGRIFSLHWLDEKTILTCHSHGKLFVWKICSSGLQEVGQLYLPACKERWTTTAVLWNETLIYGDRAGNIHSALVSQSQNSKLSTVTRAHSRLGVCSLSVHNGCVWSTGRDGTVKQFSVTNHCLELKTSSKLPFSWIAQIIHTKNMGSLILSFQESCVLLWSLKERRKLLSLPCGGGHRSWTCFIDSQHFCFAYLKDKTAHILLCPTDQAIHPVILDGFHGGEINSMAEIANGWLVSGGEDGTLRLSCITNNYWATPVVEHSHLSSVRAVHVCNCPLLGQPLIASAGGRAQLKIWRANLAIKPSVRELCSEMLRDEKQGRHWINSCPEPDPETRYMDLDSFLQSDSSLCVLAACSDAFLRVFYFDTHSNKLELHKSLRKSQHCLLRVTSLKCNDKTRLAVTTATNGSVTMWDVSQDAEVQDINCERLHKSGVNGLSVSCDQIMDHILVATGGDDNTLALTCYRITTEPFLSLLKSASWFSSTLHSSIITGVQIVRGFILCSAGDQRISLLSWTLTDDTLSVQLLAQCCCSVPDIKGLTVLQADENEFMLCVYGVGIEVMKIKSK